MLAGSCLKIALAHSTGSVNKTEALQQDSQTPCQGIFPPLRRVKAKVLSWKTNWGWVSESASLLMMGGPPDLLPVSISGTCSLPLNLALIISFSTLNLLNSFPQLTILRFLPSPRQYILSPPNFPLSLWNVVFCKYLYSKETYKYIVDDICIKLQSQYMSQQDRQRYTKEKQTIFSSFSKKQEPYILIPLSLDNHEHTCLLVFSFLFLGNLIFHLMCLKYFKDKS